MSNRPQTRARSHDAADITTRRQFLSASAITVGTVATSPRLLAQAAGPSAETRALSDYMSGAAARALPADAAEQAKHHLLDTLAAMISGTALPPGAAAQDHIEALGAPGTSTIAGTQLAAAPIDAALANGVTAHADETDDSHNASRSRPGCAVVPAALAVGEAFAVDGARFLRAVTLGYDVGTRVVMAMGGFDFGSGTSFATHSIAGTFCASAAAASIIGLDAQQMRWVLDYAAQQASGITAWRRDVDHIEKAFVFGGMPARNGVTAALVVSSGWTGLDDIFMGPGNFFAAYAPDADRGELTDGLGERFEVARTDIKKWTVGSPIQGVLDCIELIRSDHAFTSDRVARVTVHLAPTVAEVVDNREIANISLQHMVAVMLLDGTVSFHAAHDTARMHDPAALRERAKVTLVHDRDLDAFLPVRVAVVEIELTDGTVLRERVEAVRGTPRNPMSRAEVVAKSRDLIEPVLGADKSARLIESIYAIEDITDIRQLRPLLMSS